MAGTVEKKLVDLGITLHTPAPAIANYVPFVRTANFMVVSGQLCFDADGKLVAQGQLGAGVSIEDGQKAARACAINILCQIKAALGDLDKVVRVVRLGAVHHLGPVRETGRRVDEAAEPHHPHHLVEIAERRLELRQQIDRAGARRSLALFERDRGAELAFSDQRAVLQAKLARHEQQASGAHEAYIIGDRCRRCRQCNTEFFEFLVRVCAVHPVAVRVFEVLDHPLDHGLVVLAGIVVSKPISGTETNY